MFMEAADVGHTAAEAEGSKTSVTQPVWDVAHLIMHGYCAAAAAAAAAA
jgi:hypothetical protein